MARKSKFSIILEAVDEVTPTAKKAGKAVDKEFLAKANEIARESTGIFGKLAGALGPVGTKLAMVGGAAVGLYSLASAGARFAREVEKIGEASGLSQVQINNVVASAQAFEASQNRITGNFARMTSGATGFVAGVLSGFSRIWTKWQDLNEAASQTPEEQRRARLRAGLSPTDPNAPANPFDAPLPATSTPRFRMTLLNDPNNPEARADREFIDARNKVARDAAVERVALYGQIATQESDAMWQAERDRLDAIKSFSEAELAFRREDAQRKLDFQIATNEDRFQRELEAYQKHQARIQAVSDSISQSVATSLHSGLSGFIGALAAGEQSIGEATKNLFSGVVSQIGTLLIQLGTAGLLMAALGTAIPALALITGSSLGVGPSLAAIAAGTAMVGAGAAIGGLGGGSSATSPGGRTGGGVGHPEVRSTRGFGDSWSGRSRTESVGASSVVVNFNSVTPVDRSEMSRFVNEELGPALSDAHRRGRLRLA